MESSVHILQSLENVLSNWYTAHANQWTVVLKPVISFTFFLAETVWIEAIRYLNPLSKFSELVLTRPRRISATFLMEFFAERSNCLWQQSATNVSELFQKSSVLCLECNGFTNKVDFSFLFEKWECTIRK